MKIRKMENKELKKVVGQCCCKIVGKPSVYETDSCCLADCKKDGRDTAHYTIYHQEETNMKIRKMENKELKKVTGQCCCKIVGKPIPAAWLTVKKMVVIQHMLRFTTKRELI